MSTKKSPAEKISKMLSPPKKNSPGPEINSKSIFSQNQVFKNKKKIDLTLQIVIPWWTVDGARSLWVSEHPPRHTHIFTLFQAPHCSLVCEKYFCSK